MTATQLLCSKVSLTVAVIAYLIWLADYSANVHWWENMLGRHQVISSGVVEVFVIAALLHLAVPAWANWTNWMFAVAAAGLAVMMLWRITIWRRLERAARILARGQRDGPP